ncbi:MAG TPA: helix-turn-helix domain-containing protein, partial [Bryobacteraceae bacterium]
MGRNKTVSDEDLLGIARETFVEKGFAASTREIARRAGVSEGVLFQRFATKEDLFFAAMIPPAADVHQ